MGRMKRTIGIAVLVLFTIMVVAGCTTAEKKEEYPTRNINGIITWGAGGMTDTLSRIVVPGTEKVLGKSLIMTNKTGASGSIGHQYVYDQKADGYTLLFSSEIPPLYKFLGISDLTYDDFEPILITAATVPIIVVHKDSPYNTLDDLINDAKQKPEKIKMGISGVGGIPYVACAILKNVSGITFNQVVYEGDGPSITALMGKQIDVTVLSPATAGQYVKNGDFKGLVIMSNEQNAALPDVPVLGEIKPEYQELMRYSGAFYGVHVKKGTPESVIKILREAFQEGYKDPKVQEHIKNNGLVPMGFTGDEAKEYMMKWQSQTAWLIYEVGGGKGAPDQFGIPKL